MSKRTNYISWDTYFMRIAETSSHRSKDPHTQVGACVVDSENRILGIGYNGFPRGCSDDEFPWTKPEKYLYVCHAEMNALLNSNNLNLVPGSKIYSTLFPCNNCAKLILQLGIKEVIYLHDKYRDCKENEASRKMFEAAGIEYNKFTYPECEKSEIRGKILLEVPPNTKVRILEKPYNVDIDIHSYDSDDYESLNAEINDSSNVDNSLMTHE